MLIVEPNIDTEIAITIAKTESFAFGTLEFINRFSSQNYLIVSGYIPNTFTLE
jgi:hypothetical protein